MMLIKHSQLFILVIVFSALGSFGGALSPCRVTNLNHRGSQLVSNQIFSRRKEVEGYYEDYYDNQEEDRAFNDYWDSESEEMYRKGGTYKVHFDAQVDPRETQLDWEVCSDGEYESLVLLPPAAVEKPTAVLHFVGGTFFGSAPKLWYRSFLEGVVRNTQCAIVVTPIPIALFKNPLQHVSLSRKLAKAFENAWVMVLEDEYGDIRDVPVCGMGHSLGARLLVVLTTLSKNESRGSIPAYKSFVLISFTNYGASAGIPGISTILRQSKMQEQTREVAEERQRRRQVERYREKLWLEDEYDEDIDEEWDGLVDDLQFIFQEQAAKVKTALTPKSEDLEFFPPPDSLWKALQQDGRYRIPETLLVQFDDDEIDQSSKLAQTLQATNSSDVKFARLRGTHLTPLSVNDDGSKGWMELPSLASQTVWKAIRGRTKTKGQEQAMRELRQSVARYIADIVTK